MYTLYTNTNYGLGINWFKSIEECMNFVKTTKPKAYKYVETVKQLPMQFYPAIYWNEQTNSPDINIFTAIELKKKN